MNTKYTVTVNNIKDTAGLAIAARTGQLRLRLAAERVCVRTSVGTMRMATLGDITAFATALADAADRPRSRTSLSMVSQFGAPWGASDNYNARVRNYFTAPSSGNYVFFVASDDNSRSF